ncbi:UNVERIFIED_CONTAM: hypothetical protein FKN15_002645 [Acipenser sinensis]
MLVRSVFTDLRTRRLGTRGSARYHYDGISVKKRSPLYARYCFLMKLNSIDSLTFLNKEKHGSYIPTKNSEDQAQTHSYPCELVRNHFWEKQLEQKYFHRFTFIADEYHNYCQDILQNVRNKELDKVQDVVIFFWKSLPISVIELMSLPDVSQFFSSYDAQLYKMIEGILINDFLEEVSVQDLKKARMFSKNFRSWLLTVLDDFPIMLQASKRKGSWHLLNLLLSDYVLHVLHSYMEEKTEWLSEEPLKELLPLAAPLESELAVGVVDPPQQGAVEQSYQSAEPANSHALTLEGITVHVVGIQVDSETGNKLIQIMLEDKSANCAVKVDLPVGQEAMVTLRDGQKFMIHTCDIGAGEDRTEEIPTSDFIYAGNST